jgi:hypothetical protein
VISENDSYSEQHSGGECREANELADHRHAGMVRRKRPAVNLRLMANGRTADGDGGGETRCCLFKPSRPPAARRAIRETEAGCRLEEKDRRLNLFIVFAELRNLVSLTYQSRAVLGHCPSSSQEEEGFRESFCGTRSASHRMLIQYAGRAHSRVAGTICSGRQMSVCSSNSSDAFEEQQYNVHI